MRHVNFPAIPMWVKVVLPMLLAVGMLVAGTYSTFETKADHRADIDTTQEGIVRLLHYKDSLDEQRYLELKAMLDTLYNLHLGPHANASPADDRPDS